MAEPRQEDSSQSSEQGRQAFWDGALRSLSPRICRYVARTGCSPEDLAEIAADVVAELAIRERAFMASADLWEFALPIVRESCRAAVARWRREFAAPADVFETPDGTTWEAREQYYERLRAWSLAALTLLPPKQAAAVELHIMRGQSYSDVAGAMRTAEGAVRRNVSAGLERLREAAPPPPRRVTCNKSGRKCSMGEGVGTVSLGRAFFR